MVEVEDQAVPLLAPKFLGLVNGWRTGYPKAYLVFLRKSGEVVVE